MKRILLCSAATVMATSAAAFGQAVDYTVMAEMFGEPVTTGATGAPQRASDVPATMIIITQEDISRAPEYDIPGILRHYSGMDVARFSFGQAEVGIRSAGTPYTPRLLVLVNGREVYLDSYGYTAWSTLPVTLEEIQQIEVVKGPQSALYGFNAVAGVINIITRNPALGDYANVTAEVGTNGYQQYRLSAGGALNDRVALRFSYGRTDAHEFDAMLDATDGVRYQAESDGFERESFALGGSVRFTDKVNFTWEVTRSEAELLELVSIYLPASTGYELTSYQAELGADTQWGYFTLGGYRNESDIGYSFGDLTGDLTSLRLQNLFRVGTNNTVRLAVEYREATTASFPDPTAGDLTSQTLAFSGMWNHKFSNALDLTLAVRYDMVDWSRAGTPNPFLYPWTQADYDVSFEEPSYNAALVWRPDFGGAMRFSAARGVQAPTMFDIGFLLPTAGLSLAGNPNTRPAIVDSLEVAYDRTFANAVEFRTAIFWQNTRDVKTSFGLAPEIFPPAAPQPAFLFGNRGDSALWGIENSLAGTHGDHWRWSLSHTFKQVDDDLTAFPVTTFANFEAVTPEHVVNAQLGYEHGRWSADAFLNYTSSTVMPFQPVFGAYRSRDIDATAALSARVGYTLTDNVAIAISAQNVNFGDGELTTPVFETEARYFATLRASF